MTPQHPDFERWSQDKQEAYAAYRREWREDFLRTRTMPPEDER